MINISDKVITLLDGPAPTIATLLDSNIEMLQDIIKKFSDLDLSDVTNWSLAVIGSGQQPNVAIAANVLMIKKKAKDRGWEITDYEANIISQAVATGVLETVKASLTSAPQVPASPVTSEGGDGTGEKVTANAA